MCRERERDERHVPCARCAIERETFKALGVEKKRRREKRTTMVVLVVVVFGKRSERSRYLDDEERPPVLVERERHDERF